MGLVGDARFGGKHRHHVYVVPLSQQVRNEPRCRQAHRFVRRYGERRVPELHEADEPLLAPTPASGLQLLDRVTRAENFGSQHMHWLEVIVDAKDPEVFRFQPHLIEANLFPR